MIYGTFSPQGPKDKILSGVNATVLFTTNSPGKNTEVGCHSLLQGIFPTQGLKLSLLLQMILYYLSNQGSPMLQPLIETRNPASIQDSSNRS